MSPIEPGKTDCDVLVVGAGPTGLMAATLLKRQGVDVRIVEKRAEPSRESRAFAIQARSLELFLSIGLADRVLRDGFISHTVDLYSGGKHVGGMDFDRAGSPDTPFQFIYLLPQSETEAILIEDLARQGIEVERGLEIHGLEQDDDGVVVRGSKAGGGETTIRARYAIGADGAHSIVRKSLGLSFEGAPYPQTFLLADCRVSWPLDHGRFRVFVHGSSIGLFLPLGGESRSRLMAIDRSAHGESGETGPAAMELHELEAAFREASGMEVALSDAVWTSRYRVHHRSVNRYAIGRVFLAGDAAHIHSPAGGQGMNTGLQDAANLAWKLALAIREEAGEGLLATYDAERRPVGAQVVSRSDRLFEAMAGRSGWEATIRDWLAWPVGAAISHMPSIQHRAFRMIGELDITYDAGRFVEDSASKLGDAGPAPGSRAPNAAVARHRDVFDLISGYAFTVLALSRRPLDAREAAPVADGLASLCAAADGIPIRAHLVSRTSNGRNPRIVFVEDAAVFDAYGLAGTDAQATYLIRPDGYVAWRSDGLDIEGCRRFLARFHGAS
ncbi:FAD-dependent monooxygenase [Aquisphaera insulae]|uniref:FAD-dependent monooxygenase n=1 Tax=Aquisphaera insulae TaxID=2712864 RepID=UPI0013ED8206|nr:FAD-dependent monooxygenase [Aquisphaera insulae]